MYELTKKKNQFKEKLALKVRFDDEAFVDLDLEEQFYANRPKHPKDAPKGVEDVEKSE